MYRNRTLIFGALIGAATGLIGAMLINKRAENNEGQAVITTGEGMRLGIMVIGLLRTIASLGDEK